MNSNKVDWSKWEVKDILPRSDRGTCRTCKHGEYWHSSPSYPSYACSYDNSHEVKISTNISAEILVPREVKIFICPCFQYVPGDNLAYLEWCHDRRRI